MLLCCHCKDSGLSECASIARLDWTLLMLEGSSVGGRSQKQSESALIVGVDAHSRQKADRRGQRRRREGKEGKRVSILHMLTSVSFPIPYACQKGLSMGLSRVVQLNLSSGSSRERLHLSVEFNFSNL